MAATARSVSPGGALLRTSRMFSLPTPLPTPPQTRDGAMRSDTATQSFPTHQAITTTGTSRQRGDWGLKRPLPLRSTTKSAQAIIRVKALDSAEQITDYSSATDHGITLQKFQELRIPMTFPLTSADNRARRRMGIPGRSVFEEDFDSTTGQADPDKKWKFRGPWLGSMSRGGFDKWLEKHVRPRRLEFQKFLKEKIAAQNLKAVQEKALDQGEEVPREVDAASITDEQVVDYLRNLRRNGDYTELYETVGQFLDLAPLHGPEYSDRALTPLTRGNLVSYQSALPPDQLLELRHNKSPYATKGPPITHPSAGISYLRTNMYLDNHPLYGPQASHPPIKARVLRPRRRGLNGGSKLGAAGFVVESPFGDGLTNSGNKTALQVFDPELEGGAKIDMQPLFAHVDAYGQVNPIFGDVEDKFAKVVAMEAAGETKIFGEEVEPKRKKMTAAEIRERYKMSSAENYGIRRLTL